MIVSAGLGCVRATTAIPGYDLTLTRDGVRAHVEGAFDAAAWWRCVERGPYSARLADELHGRPLVLACLSRAYAPLVAPELAAIPPDRLRIFGRALDGVLPPAVAACVLPYDDRLETAGPPGTRSDFAQRALMHYAEKIAPSSDGSLALDRAAVTAALASQPQPRSIPARTRADDEAIRELIARLLPVVGKGSSAMLRHLRDREGFACEQGRFARLYRDVAERS
ncbi:MAG TPA: hypothetical protein VK665_17470 [Candidatus Elarobacter sp.]|nr:hypothetical protein [Candidatus Elarobacter sp.]